MLYMVTFTINIPLMLAYITMDPMGHNHNGMISPSHQWPFQDPKLEVPTIYKAYVRPM